jgi:hypothetical protein
MADALGRNAVFQESIVYGVCESSVSELKKPRGNERESAVCRGKSAILVQPGSGLGENLGRQRDPALGLRLEKAQTVGLRILQYPDHIFPAHRHVAVILPA